MNEELTSKCARLWVIACNVTFIFLGTGLTIGVILFAIFNQSISLRSISNEHITRYKWFSLSYDRIQNRTNWSMYTLISAEPTQSCSCCQLSPCSDIISNETFIPENNAPMQECFQPFWNLIEYDIRSKYVGNQILTAPKYNKTQILGYYKVILSGGKPSVAYYYALKCPTVTRQEWPYFIY